MRRNILHVAAIVAALGAAPATFAQSATSSTSSSTSSSPGVSQHNDSETGVAIPGDAPVDSRTLQPAQIGTGSTSESTTRNGESTGAGGPAYTDQSQGSTGSSSNDSSTTDSDSSSQRSR